MKGSLCWGLLLPGQGALALLSDAILSPTSSSIPCWPHGEIAERMFHATWVAVRPAGQRGWARQGPGRRGPIMAADVCGAVTLRLALY